MGIARRNVKAFICLIDVEKEPFNGNIKKSENDPIIAVM
jgi:hypothetical protein